MGLSTFVLGTALTVLSLAAAGLLAAMVLLEWRAEPQASAPADAGRKHGGAPARHRKPGQGRRACGRA